jgi:hypothetical protein
MMTPMMDALERRNRRVGVVLAMALVALYAIAIVGVIVLN